MDNKAVVYEMVVLFILMAAGYGCFNFKLLDLDMNKKLSKLVLYLTSPSLILASVSQGMNGDKKSVYYIIIIAAAMYLILPLIAIIINKLLFIKKEQKNIYSFMTIFSNIGFMGYPVVSVIFGQDAVFYASIFNLMFNICLYSYGVHIFSRSKDTKTKLQLKGLINPGIIAAIAALIIFLLELKMPYILSRSFTLIGGITTPMAMIIIGSTLASMPINRIFNDGKIYIYTLVRQIFVPFILWIVLKSIGFDSFVLSLTLIVSAMPVGITAVMFANEYGEDAELAARGIFITTLASFITIPLITLFLKI